MLKSIFSLVKDMIHYMQADVVVLVTPDLTVTLHLLYRAKYRDITLKKDVLGLFRQLLQVPGLVAAHPRFFGIAGGGGGGGVPRDGALRAFVQRCVVSGTRDGMCFVFLCVGGGWSWIYICVCVCVCVCDPGNGYVYIYIYIYVCVCVCFILHWAS